MDKASCTPRQGVEPMEIEYDEKAYALEYEPQVNISDEPKTSQKDQQLPAQNQGASSSTTFTKYEAEADYNQMTYKQSSDIDIKQEVDYIIDDQQYLQASLYIASENASDASDLTMRDMRRQPDFEQGVIYPPKHIETPEMYYRYNMRQPITGDAKLPAQNQGASSSTTFTNYEAEAEYNQMTYKKGSEIDTKQEVDYIIDDQQYLQASLYIASENASNASDLTSKDMRKQPDFEQGVIYPPKHRETPEMYYRYNMRQPITGDAKLPAQNQGASSSTTITNYEAEADYNQMKYKKGSEIDTKQEVDYIIDDQQYLQASLYITSENASNASDLTSKDMRKQPDFEQGVIYPPKHSETPEMYYRYNMRQPITGYAKKGVADNTRDNKTYYADFYRNEHFDNIIQNNADIKNASDDSKNEFSAQELTQSPTIHHHHKGEELRGDLSRSQNDLHSNDDRNLHSYVAERCQVSYPNDNIGNSHAISDNDDFHSGYRLPPPLDNYYTSRNYPKKESYRQTNYQDARYTSPYMENYSQMDTYTRRHHPSYTSEEPILSQTDDSYQGKNKDNTVSSPTWTDLPQDLHPFTYDSNMYPDKHTNLEITELDPPHDNYRDCSQDNYPEPMEGVIEYDEIIIGSKVPVDKATTLKVQSKLSYNRHQLMPCTEPLPINHNIRTENCSNVSVLYEATTNKPQTEHSPNRIYNNPFEFYKTLNRVDLTIQNTAVQYEQKTDEFYETLNRVDQTIQDNDDQNKRRAGRKRHIDTRSSPNANVKKYDRKYGKC